MNPINLHITYLDGSKAEASASAPDFVAFERHFQKSVQTFSKDVHLEYLLFLSWNALNRRKETKLDFDEWIDTVANVGVDDPKA
jgi:hypothetical protein